MRLLYHVFIHLYGLSIRMAALFNHKAKLWIKGRKHWKKQFARINFNGESVYWFHCASLGEFEQGRPLIETLKAQTKGKILLTFFSPSGFELRKNYPHADWICYLPLDTQANVRYFLDLVQPKAVFFIKYEFWFNYLKGIKDRNIPAYLISGIFRKNHHFFKWYGAWTRKQLMAFHYFFIQNQESFDLLKSIGFSNAQITGDTRIDRVIQIKNQSTPIASVDEYTKNNAVIIAGSTYAADESILKYCLQSMRDTPLKIVMAPHVVSESRCKEIETLFGIENCIRYSSLSETTLQKPVLIIDNIGMLASLYAYGTINYIGGGFGKGIHNTLEAAVYGIPIIFGPNYHKFEEAKDLIKTGAAFAIHNDSEFINLINRLLRNKPQLEQAGMEARNYVYAQAGALHKIMIKLKSDGILN